MSAVFPVRLCYFLIVSAAAILSALAFTLLLLLLVQPVAEGKRHLPLAPLEIAFGVKICALCDVAPAAGVKYVADAERECAILVQHIHTCGEVGMVQGFGTALRGVARCAIVECRLHINFFQYRQP